MDPQIPIEPLVPASPPGMGSPPASSSLSASGSPMRLTGIRRGMDRHVHVHLERPTAPIHGG